MPEEKKEYWLGKPWVSWAAALALVGTFGAAWLNNLERKKPEPTLQENKCSCQKIEEKWSEYTGCLAETAYPKKKAELYCPGLKDAIAYRECKTAEKEFNDQREKCLGIASALKEISDNDDLVDRL